MTSNHGVPMGVLLFLRWRSVTNRRWLTITRSVSSPSPVLGLENSAQRERELEVEPRREEDDIQAGLALTEVGPPTNCQWRWARIVSTRLPLNLGGNHRAEPVRPVPNSFMANLDAAVMDQIPNVSQRQRERVVAYLRQADDIGARLEVPERGALCHISRLANHHVRRGAKFL